MAIGNSGAVVRQLRTLFNLGTIRELTDGQLLERFATGEGEPAELAFAALVERHGPMVLRVCRAVLIDPHDTQDAFQATFLVLVKKARGLWVHDSLGPWLHQVAYRTASCSRLTSARRHRHERNAAALRTESRAEVHDDLTRVLHEEIERLPERFRVPLILCDLEGRSHEQAARHLGWPIGTVKSRQARGRDRLRDRLRRRGVAPHSSVLAAAIRPDPASALVSPALVDSTIKAGIHFVTACTLVPGTASSLTRGVLTSMFITQWSKVGSVLLLLGATASGAGLLAQKGMLFAVSGTTGKVQAARADDVPATTAKAGKVSVTLIEKGNLDVSEAADAYCLVEGQTTIIWIVPDGSAVKTGQIVCKLDSALLRDSLVNQIISHKSAEAKLENAKLAREVAEIAVIEYVEGIYKSDLAELKDAATAAESAIRKADARLERTRLALQRMHEALGKKGAERSSTDIMAELDIADRLESADEVLAREKMTLERTKVKKSVLENFTKPRTVKELQADVERKRSDELAKKATWELEISKARKLGRLIAACDIKAPADGTISYANSPDLRLGHPPQIEEGATVRERQRIFRVIDAKARVHVNAKVHGSRIAKLSRNMKTKIRVDAFADETFDGTILEIAPLPDPAGGADVYTTRVSIDKPLRGLRPGMSAEVEFLVSDLDAVISVPVAAIVRYNDKDHVAVKKGGGGWDWREVILGVSNDRVVEVKDGLKSGEQVAVKPQDLLTEQQRRDVRGTPTPPTASPSRPR